MYPRLTDNPTPCRLSPARCRYRPMEWSKRLNRNAHQCTGKHLFAFFELSLQEGDDTTVEVHTTTMEVPRPLLHRQLTSPSCRDNSLMIIAAIRRDDHIVISNCSYSIVNDHSSTSQRVIFDSCDALKRLYLSQSITMVDDFYRMSTRFFGVVIPKFRLLAFDVEIWPDPEICILGIS